MRAQVPSGVREMTAIPGFGPKKAMAVYQELGIESVPALVAAAEAGGLRALKGFSAKTESNVLQGAKRMSTSGGRVLVSVALELAEDLVERLRGIEGVRRVAYAGRCVGWRKRSATSICWSRPPTTSRSWRRSPASASSTE